MIPKRKPTASRLWPSPSHETHQHHKPDSRSPRPIHARRPGRADRSPSQETANTRSPQQLSKPPPNDYRTRSDVHVAHPHPPFPKATRTSPPRSMRPFHDPPWIPHPGRHGYSSSRRVWSRSACSLPSPAISRATTTPSRTQIVSPQPPGRNPSVPNS